MGVDYDLVGSQLLGLNFSYQVEMLVTFVPGCEEHLEASVLRIEQQLLELICAQ